MISSIKRDMEALPKQYEELKNKISDRNLQKIYSKFDFIYLDATKKNMSGNEIRSILLEYLNDFGFIVFNFTNGFEENKYISNMVKKTENKQKFNDRNYTYSLNIIICAEAKCFIFENINFGLIQQILSEIKAKQINISDLIQNQTKQLTNRHCSPILEEIDTFKKHFSKSGIIENLFVRYTFSAIAGYLIRRFFYPRNLFKDLSFFIFKSNSKEQEFKRKFNFLLKSINIDQIQEFNEELQLNNDCNYDYDYDKFKENDFIKLRKVNNKDFIPFYLVIHIESLHIFLMKDFSYEGDGDEEIDKEINKYKNREIQFCQNYLHRCFVRFYGFINDKDEKITGLIYEYMVNDNLQSFVEISENQNNQLLIYMTIIRILEALKYLQSQQLIYRDLKPQNILLNNDFIPFISDIETVKKINCSNEPCNENISENVASLQFMSPEQYKGQKVSFATDIYSFGKIIYYLFENKIDDFCSSPNISNCSKIINFLYKSCVKKDQNERIKIEDIYRIIANEITNCQNIHKIISNLNIIEKTSEISQFLFDIICVLLKLLPEAEIKQYYYKFYLMILLELTKIDEFKSIAYNNLGNLYRLGFGTIKTHKKAKYYYELAAKLNNPYSINSIGDLYRFGYGVNREYTKAKEFYERAAELGDSDALYCLGYLYYNGYGVEVNKNKAIEYFYESYKLKNTHAICMLGFLHEMDDIKGIEKNGEKAIKYYEEAISLKNYNGYVNIALLYLKGGLVNIEHNIAKSNFEKAAEKNIPNGFYNLGKMYLKEKGVKKDIKRAKEYLKRAKSFDHMDAMYYLGKIYFTEAKELAKLNKDDEKIKKLYKKAFDNFIMSAQKGCPESLLKLAKMYENGLGVEKNLKKAHQYYELACENGNYSAIFKLATHLFNGDIFEINIKKSFHYFMKCMDTEMEQMKKESGGYYNICYNKYYHRAKNEFGLICFLFDECRNNELAIKYIRDSA